MKSYLCPRAGMLFIAVAVSTIAGFVSIAVQFIKGRLLDSAIGKTQEATLQLTLVLLCVIAFEILCYYLFNRVRGKYQADVKEHLRQDFFVSHLHQAPGRTAQQNQGQTLAAYTEQLDTVHSQLFVNLPLFSEVILKIIMVSAMLFFLDMRIALLTIFLSTTPLYVPKLIQKRLEKARLENTQAFASHLSRVNQWLEALDVIRNFGAQAAILNRFSVSNRYTRQKYLDMLKTTYLSQTLSTCLSYLSHFVILAYAAYLLTTGSFTAGDFFIAVGMIDQMSYPILSISMYLQEMVAARPVFEALRNQMAAKPDGQINKTPLHHLNTIAINRVSFAYPDAGVLFENLNLKVKAGQKVLITGTSGGGKTTLINLLMAYGEPTRGQILYDDIQASQVSNLNQLVTIMRQQPMLLEDSLRNNLSLYQPIGEADLITALQQVNLHQYASPKGLEHPVSESGQNLSGGEKRRICLARSLLRKTPVLILDEPLAEVDPDSVQLIEELLISLKGQTLFAISHQVSPRLLDAFDHHLHIGK